MNSALHIPELVEEIFGYADTQDLPTHALVCPTWTHAVQSRIFSHIQIGDHWRSSYHGARRISALLNILHQSPHLAAFVLTLDLRLAHTIMVDDFERLCRSGFTILRALCLSLPSPLPSRFLPSIQTLLALESLTSVTLDFQFQHVEDLVEVWRDSSPSIRHVEFPRAQSVKPSGISAPSTCLDPYPKIQLDTFMGVDWLLDDPRCPFDLSRLAAFRCCRDFGAHAPPRALLDAARDAVVIVSADTQFSIVNLSIFERLTQLGIAIPGRYNFAYGVASIMTIPAQARSQIRALRLSISTMVGKDPPVIEVARGISEIQAVLPNLRIVVVVGEFQTPTMVQSVEECFPGLNPETLLRWSA
ncbi:hypothetical protein FB45DRAFT_1031935 [Roridomyces roridus]|uniref:F-box domain-containing protein n=1 Tax=Roridomyces roridus TaxID=1738132 RepID=A0AAD7BIH0_9AGAR|nr:hypothetical protein FB45DRAFT_1031935 [Roridomyces roridus]